MNIAPEQFELIKEQFKTLKERSEFYARKFEGIDLGDVQDVYKRQAQSGTLVSTADLIHGGKTIAANPVSTVVPVDGSASGTPKISVSKTTTVSQAAPGSQIPYTITAVSYTHLP